MPPITLAIPSATTAGLTGARSDHFGHCPVFTLVDVENNQATNIRTVTNIAHTAGGYLKPVAMLAEQGVTAMVVAGLGKSPFQKMQQHGIAVYFADLQSYPDVAATIAGFIQGKLAMFGTGQLCPGGGNCHH